MNIPNVLSLYRLLSFPFVLYLAVAGYEGLFTLFLCINLVTDILDGLIARAFNMMTAIGAKLDSLADLGTYILAFIGVYCFRAEAFQPHILSGSLFLGFFVLSYVVAYIKFKKLLSLHLYSAKIGAYMQGTFFFVLFCF